MTTGLITDQTSIFGLVHFKTWTGTYSGSFGNQELLANTITTNVKFTALDSNANLKTTFNTYYKMEGFNPITSQYENWHSQNTPLMVPPSGNALTNVSVVSSWIDR
jgi:hypothetical protein